MALLQRQAGWNLSRLLFGSPSLSSPSKSPVPLLSTLTLPSISISLPGFISDIWEGILKAVPKKKTSHMKRRHRQLAGKALKDVRSIITCPGCGRPKKSHFLCPYCVAEIKHILAKKKDPYTGGPKSGGKMNKQIQKGKGGVAPNPDT